MPRGVDHVGLTEPDMQAASDFLVPAFGAVNVCDVHMILTRSCHAPVVA